MKKIYISGKITGDILYKAKFKTAAEYLKAKGYEVINPQKQCCQIASLQHGKIICS